MSKSHRLENQFSFEAHFGKPSKSCAPTLRKGPRHSCPALRLPCLQDCASHGRGERLLPSLHQGPQKHIEAGLQALCLLQKLAHLAQLCYKRGHFLCSENNLGTTFSRTLQIHAVAQSHSCIPTIYLSSPNHGMCAVWATTAAACTLMLAHAHTQQSYRIHDSSEERRSRQSPIVFFRPPASLPKRQIHWKEPLL